jgi:hypothetical protein
MTTIIDKNTGELLYATSLDFDLQENEIAIAEILNENFVKPFYNFETKTFYENATKLEIDNSVIITEPTKEELIQTVNFLDEQLKEVKQQLNNL